MQLDQGTGEGRTRLRATARRRRGIASALAVAALLALALPAAAQDGKYTGQCRKLSKQIAHFEDQVDVARANDNPSWQASTEAHVSRLRNRRSRLCPEYDRWVVAVAAEKRAREFAALMKTAGQAALSYFTAGAY